MNQYESIWVIMSQNESEWVKWVKMSQNVQNCFKSEVTYCQVCKWHLCNSSLRLLVLQALDGDRTHPSRIVKPKSLIVEKWNFQVDCHPESIAFVKWEFQPLKWKIEKIRKIQEFVFDKIWILARKFNG